MQSRTLAATLVVTWLSSAFAQSAAESDAMRQSLRSIQERAANSLAIIDTPVKPGNWRDLITADMVAVAAKAATVRQTAVKSTSNSIVVPAGGSLQTAINDAQPGDIIMLQAGAVYTGNFVLPAKTGDGVITITSTRVMELPRDGQRVNPSHAPLMPRIVAPNASPALRAANGAHHYKIVGVEFTVASGIYSLGIVQLGSGSEVSLSLLPHDIELDRVYIHGDPNTGGKRGATLNGISIVVANSYVSDVRSPSQETQALCGWNTPGPLRIVNNRLEAGSMPIMIGGADPAVVGVTPSDITIANNHLTRPLAWRGQSAVVKNLLELKTGRRVSITGNVFENVWAQSQVGYAIVLKVGETVVTPSITSDVVVSDNIIRHAAGGVSINAGNASAGLLSNVTIKNNLFDDIGPHWGSSLPLFGVYGANSVTIVNNTATPAVTPTAYINSDGVPANSFVFHSNIVPWGRYGMHGSGRSDGNGTLTYYFPGAVFTRNVLYGGTPNPANYPMGNFFAVSETAVGWADAAAGAWKLSTTSPYYGAGMGGADPGVSYNTLISKTAMALRGM
jgi:hypothetical protein